MIVYWNMYAGENNNDSSLVSNHSGMRTYVPEPVKDISPEAYNVVGKKDSAKCAYPSCPAFRDYRKNLFAVRSPIDYEIKIDPLKEIVVSTSHDQKMFEDLITVRSVPDKLASIHIALHLFTENESLVISQETATLHSNSFINNTILIPGKFDVGKWSRPLEVAFHIKNNSVRVTESEVLYYVRLHTDEDITFKHFLPSPRFIELREIMASTKHLKTKISPLSFYYDIFAKHKNLKKMLFNEIKDNLTD